MNSSATSAMITIAPPPAAASRDQNTTHLPRPQCPIPIPASTDRLNTAQDQPAHRLAEGVKGRHVVVEQAEKRGMLAHCE